MTLKDLMVLDLKEAMLARDKIRVGTIRAVLTSIRSEEVSGKEARALTESEVITILRREAKKRREAAEAFDQVGAKDRADQERAEGVVISEYLPKQLSEIEIKALIAQAIAETGANSPGQMGLVMKFLMQKTTGKADGATFSGLVKAALAGGN